MAAEVDRRGRQEGRGISRALTSGWVAAAILAVFYLTLLGSVRDKSATFDEPGHATAGYVYWKLNDYRLDPENGNLSKRWLALPFIWSPETFPAHDSTGWVEPNIWLLSDEWFNRLGHDTGAMLARGRAMSGLIAVSLGGLVWWWSRRLFGPGAALLSLGLFVLNPGILANGALMTSDVPAALGFLAALCSISLVLERVTVWRIGLCAIALSGLFLAKMSAILVVPMALVLIVARLADGRPLPVGEACVMTGRRQQIGILAAIAAVQLLSVCAAVWACYGFRYSAFSSRAPTPARFNHSWEWALGLTAQNDIREARSSPETLSPTVPTPAKAADLRTTPLPPQWIPRMILFAREHRLLPEAFLFGYASVWKASNGFAAFLNGKISDKGWRGFFPFVFAAKTPLALVAIIITSLLVAIVSCRRIAGRQRKSWWAVAWTSGYELLPLFALCLVYGTAAIYSRLNIGHRHLLPIYPPLFILAGAPAGWLYSSGHNQLGAAARRRSQATFGVMVAVLAVESAAWFPNYLAYFNGLVSPARAYRHVIDSSLDWGQELPAIARYLNEHRDERAYVAYFGVGNPRYYGIEAPIIGGFPGLDAKLTPPLKPMINVKPQDVTHYLQRHPDYDPDLIFRLDDKSSFSVLLIKRDSAMQLQPGLYIVSASLLPPLFWPAADTDWNLSHEQAYKELRSTVAPLMTNDRQTRTEAVSSRTLQQWLPLIDSFNDMRLARLMAFLRKRDPVATINYSVLVYRLNERDLSRALDGPPP